MAKKTKLNRQQTEAKINLRAWEDPAFREQLKVNPHAALQAMGMTQLPEHIEIRVAEENANQWVIRLYNRPVNFEELSAKELKKVATGEAQKAKCCPKNPS